MICALCLKKSTCSKCQHFKWKKFSEKTPDHRMDYLISNGYTAWHYKNTEFEHYNASLEKLSWIYIWQVPLADEEFLMPVVQDKREYKLHDNETCTCCPNKSPTRYR